MYKVMPNDSGDIELPEKVISDMVPEKVTQIKRKIRNRLRFDDDVDDGGGGGDDDDDDGGGDGDGDDDDDDGGGDDGDDDAMCMRFDSIIIQSAQILKAFFLVFYHLRLL